MKRLIDLCAATLLLTVLSPFILLTAILVRIKIGKPVFFRQQRPGLNGKPFVLYKFRTMTDAKDNNGVLLSDNLRLTGFGIFLRKYSLDEFPQLFNVIKGELSLVGPRPLLMDYLPLYSEEQAKRHDVRPGITGWSQVNGRNAITWEEKLQLDVWYVENHSLWLDCKIMMLTFMRVIRPVGINNANHATMPLFRGSEHHRDA
ncbi:sugar transferase [Paenibacillus mendelii]|uniref:Sugar transferase n=1 Tax=Paenibacillus mendelii TaxID=206163 RepID=A0ABV6JKH7_9BACL|nr:sugar transferase [Paenibacillus mendelii]MCQ6558982.1 sugar transferase [Paenibacillus mendelii]